MSTQVQLKDMTPEQIADAVRRTPNAVIQQRAHALLHAPDRQERIAEMWEETRRQTSWQVRLRKWIARLPGRFRIPC